MPLDIETMDRVELRALLQQEEQEAFAAADRLVARIDELPFEIRENDPLTNDAILEYQDARRRQEQLRTVLLRDGRG